MIDAFSREEVRQQIATRLVGSREGPTPILPRVLAALRLDRSKGIAPATLSELRGERDLGILARSGDTPVALVRPQNAGDHIATGLRIGDEMMDIAFTDPLREDAAEALAALDHESVGASIISGDRSGAVETIATTLGIAAKAELLPEGLPYTRIIAATFYRYRQPQGRLFSSAV